MLMTINMLIYIYGRENEDVLDEIIYQVCFDVRSEFMKCWNRFCKKVNFLLLRGSWDHWLNNIFDVWGAHAKKESELSHFYFLF